MCDRKALTALPVDLTLIFAFWSSPFWERELAPKVEFEVRFLGEQHLYLNVNKNFDGTDNDNDEHLRRLLHISTIFKKGFC